MSKNTLELPIAREVALTAATKALNTKNEIQAVLDSALQEKKLHGADAGLATELAYGWLRHKGRIDFVLDSFLKNPRRVPAKARAILGMAAYELLFLDKVPAYASLDWSVSAVKARFGTSMGGMCNGVLRNIERLEGQAGEPDFYKQDNPTLTEFWSRYYSVPEWLASLWLKSYGPEEAELYLKAQIQRPLPGVRVNMSSPGGPRLAEKLSDNPDLVFQEIPSFAFAPGKLPHLANAFKKGTASRQGAASAQALLRLDPLSWPVPVFDACAGRGGKTMLLVESGVPVAAGDVSMNRLRGLHEDVQRLRQPDIPVFRARADQDLPFNIQFGTILVDAPCSGLGVLSRRPDAKWKRKPRDIRDLSRLQYSIMESCARSVRDGGLLVYMTCTLCPDENTRLVRRFLKKHREFKRHSDWATPADSPLREFFYGAVLKKKD